MMQGIRRFDVYRGLESNGLVVTNPVLLKVPKAADVATRVNRVMPGRLIVQAVAGNNATWDAASAADTTGTPGRLIGGLCLTVCDINGRRKDRQVIETTEEGAVLVAPVARVVLVGLEDGVGGNIADSGGFCSIVLGTPTGEQPNETNYYTPLPNDEIDSSTTASGTAANRALQLIAPVPDITNIGRRQWQFVITSAFRASL